MTLQPQNASKTVTHSPLIQSPKPEKTSGFKFGTTPKSESHQTSNKVTNKSNNENKSVTESPQNPVIKNITENLNKLVNCKNVEKSEVIKMLNENIIIMAECCNDNEKLDVFNSKLNKLIDELKCEGTQSGGAKRTRRRKAKRKSKRKSKRHSRR